MKSIYERETELLNQLTLQYPEEDRSVMTFDGLCSQSIYNTHPNLPDVERKWTESSRRVLFLLKEPRDLGDDYREWPWNEGTEKFGNVLAYWLEGLNETSKDVLQDYDSLSWRDEILKKYPLAIVNIKKTPSGPDVGWNVIWEYANTYKDYLKSHIRDILKPNIIVCGGSNDSDNKYEKVITIAMDVIFDDIKEGFVPLNNWCYYNRDYNIMLIDSYHPSSRNGYHTLMDGMFEAFQQAIKNFDVKL